MIKAISIQASRETGRFRPENPNKVIKVTRRIRNTIVFADLPATIAASPPITPDAIIRPTEASMPAAMRLQPGNCLLFHQYMETKKRINKIRPRNIRVEKSVLINPAVAIKPGMIASSALFHDKGSFSWSMLLNRTHFVAVKVVRRFSLKGAILLRTRHRTCVPWHRSPHLPSREDAGTVL